MPAAQFDIEALIQRGADAKFSREYNCNLRRLFPWSGVADTKRAVTELGCIWVVVEPGCTVDAHSHDEEEAFIAIAGRAQIAVSGQQAEISAGDVVYIPRFAHHQVRNHSTNEPFAMIDVYWDAGPAVGASRARRIAATAVSPVGTVGGE